MPYMEKITPKLLKKLSDSIEKDWIENDEVNGKAIFEVLSVINSLRDAMIVNSFNIINDRVKVW